MLLPDIISLLNESFRNAHVVDDDPVDRRIIQDWVMLQRSVFLKNYMNQNSGMEQNTLQSELLDVDKYDTTLELSGLSAISLGKYILRTDLCPTLLEGRAGIAVSEITSADILSRTIQLVPMDRLRWCGNGKVNKHFLFAAFDDSRFYLKSNSEIEKPITRLKVSGVFADPTLVSTYIIETDNYPINDYSIAYMIRMVQTQDFSFLNSQKSDTVNNANGEMPIQG